MFAEGRIPILEQKGNPHSTSKQDLTTEDVFCSAVVGESPLSWWLNHHGPYLSTIVSLCLAENPIKDKVEVITLLTYDSTKNYETNCLKAYKYLYGGFLKQGYPQSSSISMGFSLLNHPFLGTPR